MNAYEEKNNTNLLLKCASKWYWFLLSISVTVGLSWYMLQKETRLWSVAGSIMVQEEKSTPGGQLPREQMMAGGYLVNRGSMDRQIQVLKSRYLMERVVDSLNLDVVYMSEGKFRNLELYRRSPILVDQVSDKGRAYGRSLRLRQVDNSRFALIRGEADTAYFNYGVPFVSDGITYSMVRDTSVGQVNEVIQVNFVHPYKVAAWFSGNLTFQKMNQSNVLAVSAVDQSPEKLVDIIYSLIETYNLFVQEEKNKMANRSLEFINERLTELSSELFSVETSQANRKVVTGVTTNVTSAEKKYTDILTTAEETRTEIGSTRNTLVALKGFLGDMSNRFEPIPSFGDLGQIKFASLIQNYNALIRARKAKLVHATPKHPEVIQFEKDLAAMRTNILGGIQLALDNLNKEESDLVEKIAPIKQRVETLPYAQRELEDIQREKGVKEELVIYMLTKREETAIGLATQVENTRILDAPVISEVPVSPSSKQYYALAFLFGLAFPTGLIYLLDRMNDKIVDRDDVKSYTAVPFLGEVAIAKSQSNRLINANSRSAIAEMFRLLRTNLQFLTSKAKTKEKVVLVTSTESGDGKTFVSANLAVCLALTNKRTIILELDLRKPKLTEFLLKKIPTVGITNYLVGEKDLPDIVQEVEDHDNLFLISSGPKPPNPAELIMSEKMEELMERLKLEFDYIVIDTPPVGLVADALLLDKFSTSSIYVIRAGKTKKNELEFIDDLCSKGKLTNPALVLNGVKTPKRYGYYY